MAAQLIVTEPSGRKRTVALRRGRKVSIGRGTASDVMVTDPRASRKHCTVAWSDRGIRVEDHDSSNQTLVNSEPFHKTSHILKDGDIVTVGDCTVRLVILGKEEGAAARAAISRKLIAGLACIMFAAGAAGGLFSGKIANLLTGPQITGLPQSDAALAVTSTPTGAMVFLNNEYVDVTPVKLFREKGTYSVRLVLAGYTPHSESVELNGRERKIEVRLAPIEPGFIVIESEPADAEVLLDGDTVGRSPVTVETTPGAHQIVIQKTRYVPWQGTVEVSAGQRLKITRAMAHRSIASYLKLLEEDPNNVSYYCQLAHLCVLEKRWAEAYDALRNAMETFAAGKDTSRYGGRMKWLLEKIYFEDYFEVAEEERLKEIRQWIIALYAEMIGKYPAQKSTLTGWLNYILKRAGRASELNNILRGTAAPDLDIYFQAADVYLGKGKYERAVGILNKAVNLGPKSFQARFRLGRAYFLWCEHGKAEVKDNAIKNLEKALELCDDKGEIERIRALRKKAAKL